MARVLSNYARFLSETNKLRMPSAIRVLEPLRRIEGMVRARA